MFLVQEDANIVCKKTLRLRDRELRISHVKSITQSTTPTKRKNPFSGDSENSPAKKFSSDSKTRTPAKKGAKTPPQSRYRVTASGDTSYQGLRASKSGESKKQTPVRRFTATTPASVNSGKNSGVKIKQRVDKRPSVAARKAKAIAMQNGGASYKPGNNKRKMDARTPTSSNKRKKVMKSK